MSTINMGKSQDILAYGGVLNENLSHQTTCDMIVEGRIMTLIEP